MGCQRKDVMIGISRVIRNVGYGVVSFGRIPQELFGYLCIWAGDAGRTAWDGWMPWWVEQWHP